MFITPTSAVFSSSAKNLPPRARQALAVAALAGKTPVSRLAASIGVSRKFVYQQSEKANNALDQAFANDRSDEEVLFYLPVTKAWLRKVVLGLVLICHSSFRGVQEFMRDLLDFDISIGSVHNVVMDTVEKAKEVNDAEHLVELIRNRFSAESDIHPFQPT